MEYVRHWSFPTLILYVGLAVIMALLFRMAIDAKNKDKKIKVFKIKFNQKYIYYFLIYAIFILFAGFRYYNSSIGGTDTVVYEKFFYEMKYVPFNLKTIFTFDGFEYLFYNFMVLIKLIGGNFFIYSIVIYSMLILAYIFVIDREFTDEKKWFWLILAFLPLLKSLNIVRNCFAAAIGIIGISLLNKKSVLSYVICYILAIIAFLNHYTAIILIGFGIYCLIIPDKLITNRKTLIILNIVILILSIVAVPLAKIILNNTGFDYYVNNVEISLIGYIPILIGYILMIWDKDIVSYLKDIKHFIYYKVMVFISFVLPFFILIGGASRMLLLFELPRFILYSDLYGFYRKKVPKKLVRTFDVLCILGIGCWFCFRIWRIWKGYGLMPYYNILFM